MSAAQHAYHYTKRLNFGLVPIPAGQKRPIALEWQHNPITDPEVARQIWANGGNMGLLHSASNTCVIDVDHAEYLALAAQHLDFDLLGLIEAAPVKILGKNGAKPLFRIPDGLSLTLHKLNWPHPTETLDNGKPRQVTVVEFRAGHGKQDVLPPSIHPDTGKPYVWVGTPPRCLEDIPELPEALVEFWENLGEHIASMRAACPWGRVDTVPTPTPYRAPKGTTGPSVINAFREAGGAIERELEAEGYIRKGTDRYLSPHSSTKMAAVVIFTDEHGVRRARSYHGSDDWADERGHDAFDLYCRFRHGGDLRAAVKAAAAELGMTHTPERTEATGPSLEAARTAWADRGTETFEAAMNTLDQTQMHHHARKAFNLLLSHVYFLASTGELQIVQGQVCVMAGGLNGLAAELGGRPHDAAARLRLASTLGFLGQVRHTDPSDKRSALLIPVPADPADLPFLKLTPEGLHSLSLRPATVDAGRPNTRKRFTPPIGTTRMATPIGGVKAKKDENPLQAALRVALVLSRQPGLALKQIAKLARCKLATARKHVAVLQERGLARGTRLTVTFQQYFQATRAAVADRTAARLKDFLAVSIKYAEHSLRLARFGVEECQRTAPARKRLLMRSLERLNELSPYGVAA